MFVLVHGNYPQCPPVALGLSIYARKLMNYMPVDHLVVSLSFGSKRDSPALEQATSSGDLHARDLTCSLYVSACSDHLFT